MDFSDRDQAGPFGSTPPGGGGSVVPESYVTGSSLTQLATLVIAALTTAVGIIIVVVVTEDGGGGSATSESGTIGSAPLEDGQWRIYESGGEAIGEPPPPCGREAVLSYARNLARPAEPLGAMHGRLAGSRRSRAEPHVADGGDGARCAGAADVTPTC